MIALVAVENCSYSFDKLFSYNIPDSMLDFITPGMRVLVPFGRGKSIRQGFVFEIQNDSDEVEGVKDVLSVLDSEPVLLPEMLKLALWIRDTCFCSYFVAAKSLLPAGVCLKTEKVYSCAADIPPVLFNSLTADEVSVINFLRKKTEAVKESVILKKLQLDKESQILKRLTRKNCLIESSEAFSKVTELSVQLIRLCNGFQYSETELLTEKQNQVIELLIDFGAASVKEITYFTGVSDSVIKTLIKKGICESFDSIIQREVKNNFPVEANKKIELSREQLQAYNQLYSAYTQKKFDSALLFGVTGSGKTSVYIELIEEVIKEGKSVIVLVPEISLTPQTFSVFSSRFGKNVALLHSGLSMGERYDEWKRIAAGKAQVIVGTRSAVFAPVENLGMIIIDEEQEHTYKSEMTPRYNAKDVARFRCKYNSAFLILASATPSIETYAKAKQSRILLCELSSRFGKAILPDVHIVDMSDKSLVSPMFAVSDPLAKEIQSNLENKEQTILLVNRRGYNTFVVCSECKNVVSCPKCNISMTYHSANNRLMCHYCGHSTAFTLTCPTCGAENIRYAGFGTQRIEQEIKIRFPDARTIRMDADTTIAKNSHEKALGAFAQGEYDILIGTQMVAKGLNFPDVTLVGIISADKELYNNDFRCSERSFDLITQVVGRAGRGNKKGRAVIQTLVPDNNIISIASNQDYKGFFASEINIRKAMIYPPFCDICEIAFVSLSRNTVFECADYFFSKLVELNKKDYSDQKIIVLGPMSPKVSKINDQYRQRIIIKCKNSPRFRTMISCLIKEIQSNSLYKNVYVSADMNPENLN